MPAKKKTEIQLPPDFDVDKWIANYSGRKVEGKGNLFSKLWIIGEAPGEWEEKYGKPFVGPSGKELDRMVLNAGAIPSDLYYDNVVPVRPPRNKLPLLGVPPTVFYPALAAKLSKFRPNCVVAAGGTALKALCGVSGITVRRGSILPSTLVPGIKVVPMVHPAELFKDWAWRTHMTFDLTRAVMEAQSPDLDLPVRTFLIRPTMQQVVEAMDAIKKAPKIAVDIETRRNRIACIGFGCSKDWAICIPLEYKDGRSYWSQEEEIEVFRIMDEVLSQREQIQIFQNHPFDFSYLWEYHLPVMGQIWDTMTMHNLLWPDMKHGLDLLCSFYTREPYYKDEGKLWESWMDEDTFWTYNCKDVCVTFEVFEKLYAELVSKGLLAFYELHYRRQQPALLSTQLTGFRIWERRRERHRKTWTHRIERAQSLLEEQFKETLTEKGLTGLNVYSPPQMRWLLYEHLHLPKQYIRGSEEPTTKEDALEKLYVKTRNPVLLAILELRGLRKYLSSYLNVTIDRDERIRCSFGHTDFGRLKATKFLDRSGTNLQTIPEVGRAFFIAD